LDITAYGDSPLNSETLQSFGSISAIGGWITPHLIGLRSRHRCKLQLRESANRPNGGKRGGPVTCSRARH
ncbi:hypothetical protein BP00DRAFT_321350, partial [Aspergillus indologenus CBS 114.80]